ncbi:MAG: Gfo/Idh/MocA family oxidoreductase, partial [Thermoplasmata archaeon]|nr:Gfo/Idh/MocA family oxidoreductase [Thermoplasmata archaeon]
MASVGLLGLGKWGLNHLRSLKDLECNLIGVYDVDKAKKSVAEEYGVKFFDNYKKLVEKVDALVVVTPTNKHYDVVRDCLLAGKHVLVEKPLAENSERARKLVE